MNVPEGLVDRLEHWAKVHYGSGAKVTDVEVMPGHAGLSYGLTIRSGAVHEQLVIRLPPKGVRRSGNTDVLRQVPLLLALDRAGIPVPPVRWWGEDEAWFDVPYLIVGRMPGRTLDVRSPAGGATPATVDALLLAAVEVLARIHALDWKTELADWERPRDLLTEIRFWDPILAKAAEPEWVAVGEGVRDLLLERQPGDPVIGLFHGDFQTNNILFDDTPPQPLRITAVLDWEISGLGATLLDVGSLLMMTDPQSWAANLGEFRAPDAAALVARYEETAGRGTTDVAWYQALAGYRFGVITCFNVMLHRRGKRPDPQWDVLAPSVTTLFGRARELLSSI
jgi:aminoglycoside phosphotransferase (APT) family kinase protein